MTRLQLASPLAALAILAGCVATPGDFCHTDADCAATLRCTGTAAVRGVCVYPAALPDAAVLRDALEIETTPRNDGIADRPHIADAAPDSRDDGLVSDGARDAADATAADAVFPDTAADLPAAAPDLPRADLVAGDAGDAGASG